MACSACGGKQRADMEWLITYNHDGSTERVATVGEARLKLSKSRKGGTKVMVPKARRAGA